MAISPQRLTIYLYSAYRAVIFAIVQLSSYHCCAVNRVTHISVVIAFRQRAQRCPSSAQIRLRHRRPFTLA